MIERVYVFCYDVSDRRRRGRIARRLEEAAVRVQRSVFEARMAEKRADRLARRLACDLGPGDSLKVYAIGKDGLTRCRAFGAALDVPRGDYLLV